MIFPHPESCSSCTFRSAPGPPLKMPRVPRLLKRLDGGNARIRQLVPIDDHLATTTEEGVRFTLALDIAGCLWATNRDTGYNWE